MHRRLCALLLAVVVLPAQADCVILLHGLARTSASMQPLQAALEKAGYQVANIDYPSRTAPIEVLAPSAVEEGLARCDDAQPVHFVTHSMGGILVRWYLAHASLPRLGRVVMLAPPNQGSEVVDRLRDVPGFAWYNGPAGLQLGTGADSLPRRLPAVDYPVGIIAGTATINYLLSTYLPNPDDGKVSVAATRVEGMQDMVEVPYSHPLLMRRQPVIRQVLAFLAEGRFEPAAP